LNSWREAAVFYRDGVSREFGCGLRCVEGVSVRWSWSRSAADGGTWREFLHDGVGRDRQRTAARGGPVLAMESLATSIGCGQRRVESLGFLLRSMEHIWREEKSGSRGGPRDACDRALAKPSAAWQLCQVAQNAKPLDTSFCDFWQITRMQTLNRKPLKMLENYCNISFLKTEREVGMRHFLSFFFRGGGGFALFLENMARNIDR